MSDQKEKKLPYEVMPPDPLPNPPYEFQREQTGSGSTTCPANETKPVQFEELKYFQVRGSK